jgi:hypothetical protein
VSARYPADRNPMSSARRDQVHGPLHPMDTPATSWDLFCHGLPGGLFLFSLGLIPLLLIVAFHGAGQ